MRMRIHATELAMRALDMSTINYAIRVYNIYGLSNAKHAPSVEGFRTLQTLQPRAPGVLDPVDSTLYYTT